MSRYLSDMGSLSVKLTDGKDDGEENVIGECRLIVHLENGLVSPDSNAGNNGVHKVFSPETNAVVAEIKCQGQFDLGQYGTSPENGGTSVLLSEMGGNIGRQIDGEVVHKDGSSNNNIANAVSHAGSTVVTSFQLNEALATSDTRDLPSWPSSKKYFTPSETATGEVLPPGELQPFNVTGNKKPINVAQHHLGVAPKAETVIPRGRDRDPNREKKPSVPGRLVETKGEREGR